MGKGCAFVPERVFAFVWREAVQAGDPDLIYSVITAALGSSDVAAREADSRTMLKLLKERPQDGHWCQSS
eukprot:4079256-Amphidinium_carterae.1